MEVSADPELLDLDLVGAPGFTRPIQGMVLRVIDIIHRVGVDTYLAGKRIRVENRSGLPAIAV